MRSEVSRNGVGFGAVSVLPLLLVSAGLLSSCGPVAASASGVAAGRQSPSEQGYPLGKGPLWEGVRLSRGFFEDQPLSGSVSLRDSNGAALYERKSAVNWQIGEPNRPEPTPGFVADFRDRPGCAVMESGLQFCLLTSPDVSTVEVNQRKASLQGLEALVTQTANSPGTCSPVVKYVDANRSETALSVVFEVTGCSVQPLRAEVAFQKI